MMHINLYVYLGILEVGDNTYIVQYGFDGKNYFYNLNLNGLNKDAYFGWQFSQGLCLEEFIEFLGYSNAFPNADNISIRGEKINYKTYFNESKHKKIRHFSRNSYSQI